MAYDSSLAKTNGTNEQVSIAFTANTLMISFQWCYVERNDKKTQSNEGLTMD
jgi:hypothetical protein